MDGRESSGNSASNVEPITCVIFPVAGMDDSFWLATALLPARLRGRGVRAVAVEAQQSRPRRAGSKGGEIVQKLHKPSSWRVFPAASVRFPCTSASTECATFL